MPRYSRRGRRYWVPWSDPLLGYRNDPEYRRQRQEAKQSGTEAEVEKRWAARWKQKLAMKPYTPP